MFTKLRNRLTIIFVILTLIPVLIISFALGYRNFSQAVTDSFQRQRLLDDRVNQAVTDLFSRHTNELALLGNTSGFDTLATADLRGLLGNLMHNQAYNDISVIMPDGQERIQVSLFAATSEDDLTNHAQEPLFQKTVETRQVNYSDIYFDDRTGEPLITLAMPFYDQRSGELSSVVFANFRFYLIWDLVRRLENQREQGLKIFLTDSAGTVIAHSNPTIVFQKRVFNLPDQDGQATGLDGKPAFVTKQDLTLGNLQLVIVGEEPTELALKGAIDAALSAALITLLTIFIVTGTIFLVTRQIVHPIEQLSQVAQAIRDGDLNAQAPVGRLDEIGKMAQVFNSMTAQLRQTLKGLQDHVKELEAAKIEREKLIHDLQAAKRLAEENSRLKSEFLSTMSHELRTPLNAIEGFTGVILNRMAGTEFNSKTEDLLMRVRSNSARLLHLINDFLDLSRIEAGRLELANQAFSPVQLVKSWKDEISVLAEKKGLQFAIRLDPSIPETLYGDEESLSKIALNLLGNAIKFTESGQIVLSMAPNNGTWDIVVEDTGIGIPPHAREFIFEEFRQVDQSSKRKYGGTGLGLSIVQKYTRAMGGTVSVKSELGKGSTFTVSIPLKATIT